MRSPELEKILEDHLLWWETEGAEGTRLDLAGADLSCANLSGANLIRADLTYVYLRGADLTGARLPQGTAGQISSHRGEQAPGNPRRGGRRTAECIIFSRPHSFCS
jgi:hypothetical protein